MLWCRHIWQGALPDYPPKSHPGRFWAVVYGATQIAANASGSWEACERQLLAYEIVAGKVSDVWLR